MIDYEQSIKAILASDQLTQEVVDFWCEVQNTEAKTKSQFVAQFDDYTEDGLAGLIMAISAGHSQEKVNKANVVSKGKNALANLLNKA